MKTRHHTRWILVGLVVWVSSVACFACTKQAELRSPPEETVVIEPKAEVPVAPASEESIPSEKEQEEIDKTALLERAKALLEDIHFDFDRFNIRADAREILKRDYSVLKKLPGARIRIEGHCDERGTVEYNLALGERRANATRTYLIGLGMNPSLIDSISYGEERPVDPRHNEEAWAKNRRAHIEIVTP